jgi:hypothetical protein
MRIGRPPPFPADRLEAGERLLWWDQPKQGIVLRSGEGVLILILLLWTACTCIPLYLLADYTGMLDDGIFAKLAIAAVVLNIAYSLIWPFLSDAWRRKRLFYGLTDKRIVFATADDFRSIRLESLGEITLKESKQGEGSITFGYAGAWTGYPSEPIFEDVKDARRVFTMVRDAQRRAKDYALLQRSSLGLSG